MATGELEFDEFAAIMRKLAEPTIAEGEWAPAPDGHEGWVKELRTGGAAGAAALASGAVRRRSLHARCMRAHPHSLPSLRGGCAPP